MLAAAHLLLDRGAVSQVYRVSAAQLAAGSIFAAEVDAALLELFEEAKQLDITMEELFTEAGVEVVHMSGEQAEAWRQIATTTSYRVFAEDVPGGAALIEKALAVE